MIPLQPEQIAILQNVLRGTAVQAASRLICSQTAIETFLAKASDLAAASANLLSGELYMLVLEDQASGAIVLSREVLAKAVKKREAVIRVDSEFRLIRTQKTRPSFSGWAQLTKQESRLGVVVAETHAYHFVCGELVGDVNVQHPNAAPLLASRWHHPIADFELLMRDHLVERVAGERGFRYWRDRKKRVFLCGPDGTEAIFHLDLYWWLNHFVADRLKVVAEPAGFGQNKTDIMVVTLDGSHVIEVKWLGRNEKRTLYGRKQIGKGLKQVGEYLMKDRDLVCGRVVFYDGRPREKHDAESDYDTKLRHPLCESPIISFLESESPTETTSKGASS